MNVKSSGTLERLQFHLAPDAEGTQGKSLGLENESNHFVSALAGGEDAAPRWSSGREPARGLTAHA